LGVRLPIHSSRTDSPL
jgi:hypothetical protein